MNNKIKTITVTEKHLDAAINASSLRPLKEGCCERCVMSQAARRAFKRKAATLVDGTIRVKTGEGNTWVKPNVWDPSASKWEPIPMDAGLVRDIIRLFDEDQYKHLRSILPITVSYVRKK